MAGGVVRNKGAIRFHGLAQLNSRVRGTRNGNSGRGRGRESAGHGGAEGGNDRHLRRKWRTQVLLRAVVLAVVLRQPG